jgi:hypothetical protein
MCIPLEVGYDSGRGCATGSRVLVTFSDVFMFIRAIRVVDNKADHWKNGVACRLLSLANFMPMPQFVSMVGYGHSEVHSLVGEFT